jgi:hypothetical protein
MQEPPIINSNLKTHKPAATMNLRPAKCFCRRKQLVLVLLALQSLVFLCCMVVYFTLISLRKEHMTSNIIFICVCLLP